MLNAFLRASYQITDKTIRRYLVISIVFTICMFSILWICVGYVLSNSAVLGYHWLDGILDFVGGFATIVISLLFFPLIASAFISFFLDDIANAVEIKYYPSLLPKRASSFTETLKNSASFLIIFICLNIVLIPLIFFPIIFPFIFYCVNGYLVGRETFELVASRRLNSEKIKMFLKTKRYSITVAGAIIAFLMTLPFVNLIAPVIGTAAMVHLFHSWNKKFNV